ncbi:hypothetical protein Dimus_001013 [Dionaea muscipula]
MGKSIQKERIGPYEMSVKEFYAKMTSDSLEEKGYCEVQRSGENRRRDDDEATPEEEAKVKMKEIELILIGRRSLMRQLLRGIVVGEKFYDA